ncbi:MAG: DUF2620 domain-containing protein [Erysipelotrichaceae bacterium]
MKIVVGGQMDKQAIARLVTDIVGDKAQVEIKSDIEATIAIQTKQADYYLGACSTGAGGALGIATGLLGMDKCVSVSTPGKTMSQSEIEDAVKNGKVAFGFVNYDIEKVVPMLLKALIK